MVWCGNARTVPDRNQPQMHQPQLAADDVSMILEYHWSAKFYRGCVRQKVLVDRQHQRADITVSSVSSVELHSRALTRHYSCFLYFWISAAAMHSSIRPNQFIALRLPSDLTKIVQLIPNTYGQFPGRWSVNECGVC